MVRGSRVKLSFNEYRTPVLRKYLKARLLRGTLQEEFNCRRDFFFSRVVFYKDILYVLSLCYPIPRVYASLAQIEKRGLTCYSIDNKTDNCERHLSSRIAREEAVAISLVAHLYRNSVDPYAQERRRSGPSAISLRSPYDRKARPNCLPVKANARSANLLIEKPIYTVNEITRNTGHVSHAWRDEVTWYFAVGNLVL